MSKLLLGLSWASLLLAPMAWSAMTTSGPANSESTSSPSAGQRAPASLKFNVKAEKYKLANGLTVILSEDHSSPMVSYQTWFRVGSRNEQPGITGIAHMFEHLMFKGTEKFKDDAYDKLLHAYGAENNAFTSQDYTGYYANFPADKLEQIMDIESDRMVNLKLTEEVLKSEREVVKEERRLRVDNSPPGALSEEIYKTAYKVHPYRWEVIGWMKDISSYKLSDFLKWYKTYYAPNNAVLVIVGDISLSKTKDLVEKYYGQLKAQPLPEVKISQEPEQNGMRRSAVYRPVQAPVVSLSYKSTVVTNDDNLVLDLIANILGQGEASRLQKSLIYTGQMATAVDVYNSSNIDQGLFQIFISSKPGGNIGAILQKLSSEMNLLRSKKVTEEELIQAKNQSYMQALNKLKTSQGKAYLFAASEIMTNDYNRVLTDLTKLEKITADEVLQVAKKYLTAARATQVILRRSPPMAPVAPSPESTTSPSEPAN